MSSQTDPGRGLDATMVWQPVDEQAQQAARRYLLSRLPDPDDILAMLGLDEGAPRW